MYEQRRHPVISRPRFARRMARHAGLVFALLLASLAAGMAGYHAFESLPWTDAFLNSAMLLGGMGPVDAPKTEGGKLFAGFYALYAGLLFIVSAGVLFAPVLHRLMHRFHVVEDTDMEQPAEEEKPARKAGKRSRGRR